MCFPLALINITHDTLIPITRIQSVTQSTVRVKQVLVQLPTIPPMHRHHARLLGIRHIPQHSQTLVPIIAGLPFGGGTDLLHVCGVKVVHVVVSLVQTVCVDWFGGEGGGLLGDAEDAAGVPVVHVDVGVDGGGLRVEE